MIRLVLVLIGAVLAMGPTLYAQSAFLNSDQKAMGFYAGTAGMEQAMGASLGLIVSRGDRVDFSLGGASLEGIWRFNQGLEFFVVRQRPQGAPLFWSVGETFGAKIIGDSRGGPGSTVGVFTAVYRTLQLSELVALQPGVGVGWSQPLQESEGATSMGLLGMSLVFGGHSNDPIVMASFSTGFSFDISRPTTYSATLSIGFPRPKQGRARYTF